MLTRIDHVMICVEDLQKAMDAYTRLGFDVYPGGVHAGKGTHNAIAFTIQRGAVIKADMAVFDLGPTGLTLAQPAEPGPAADALARSGPGPFQVLYRTSSMEVAARWMAEHGVPLPVRGVRNTGEHAMLVPPEHACGAFIGFAGPA